MEVQFVGRDGKILYCNGEIVRVTKKGNTKEWKIKALGQAVLENNILFLGGIDGQLEDYVEIRPKKQLNRTLKVTELINRVGENTPIDRACISRILKKKKAVKIASVAIVIIVLLRLYGAFSDFFITQKMIDSLVGGVMASTGFENSYLSDGTYYAELLCTNNDGGLYAIHDVLMEFNQMHEKIGLSKISLVAKKGDRVLYKTELPHEYLRSVDFFQFDDIQTAKKILRVRDVNPLKVVWRDIKSFTGNSITRTSTFTVGENGAKVNWNTSPGEYGDFNFVVFMYFSNGDFADPYGIANVIGSAKGESFIKTPGTYYFDINTAQQFSITVREPHETE